MEPVQSTLKKWMQENKGFKAQYEYIKKETLHDPIIKDFLELEPQLTDRDIEKNLMKLYEYKIQSKECDRCKCFEECINTLQGYSPILQVNGKEIHLSYEKCHSRIAHEKQSVEKELIQSLYMPKEILNATIDHVDTSESARSQAIIEIGRLFEEVEKDGLPSKGMYFHGPFGIGKTYLLGVVANFLKEYKYNSMLIYMPEFVREMKNAISDGSLNRKIEQFKSVDVLMLDDIGAETQSAWFRDEVLGSILQYRMMEQLPVFFTSNFNLQELIGQLEETRGKVEQVKAKRIIERIKQVSNIVKIDGENRRL